MPLDENDLKVVGETVTAAVAGAVTRLTDETLKPLTERVEGLAGKLASVEAKPAGETIKLADVQKLLADELGKRDAAEAEKAKAAETGKAKSDARAKFVGEKAKDLPAVYQALIAGDDEKALADSEQAARKQFRADLTASGAKLPDVGAPAAGKSVIDASDPSKLSAAQKIEVGLAAGK